MATKVENLKDRLVISDERELHLAAEAVVDAAIWRYRLKAETLGGRLSISDSSRRSLIDLVYEEPSLTHYLFTDEIWEKH